jgi:hypothetical protein
MRAPAGVDQIEYIAIALKPWERVRDIMPFLDNYSLAVFVNGREWARVSLISLPMEPKMSGRFVFRPHHIPVRQGDDVTAQLCSDSGLHLDIALRVDAGLSFTGLIDQDALTEALLPRRGILHLESAG